MENQQLKFNELTREVLEDFIAKLPKEEKKKLREYVETHPRNSPSGMFAMVKSYVYNNFFRPKPALDERARGNTFADTLELLLRDEEDAE